MHCGKMKHHYSDEAFAEVDCHALGEISYLRTPPNCSKIGWEVFIHSTLSGIFRIITTDFCEDNVVLPERKESKANHSMFVFGRYYYISFCRSART
jgi:hypothetical protein